MKKSLIIILSLCLFVLLVACAGGDDANSSESGDVSSEISSESSEASVETSDEDAASSEIFDESASSTENSEESIESDSGEETSDSSEVFDVTTLVGTWKRVATEVEGDVNEGGNCTITITGTSRDDLKISYDDKEFPDAKFSDKNVTISERENETGWLATVDYVSARNTRYDFTILENGRLELCNSFEIDGAPAVAFEIFEKAE